jgi:hypothetical protein
MGVGAPQILRARRNTAFHPAIPAVDLGDAINAGLVGLWLPGLTLWDLSGINGLATTASNGGSYPIPAMLPNFGRGLQFGNGSSNNAYMSVGSALAGLIAETNKLTLAGWTMQTASLSGTTNQNFIICKPDGSSSGQTSPYVNFGITLSYDNLSGQNVDNLLVYPEFELSTSNARTIAWSSTAAVIGVPVFVAGTYDGANMRLYVNGAAISGNGVQSKSGTIDNPSYNVYVGAQSNAEPNSQACKCIVDNVRAYNRALSPAEILRLYAEPFAGLVSPHDWITAQLGLSGPFVPPIAAGAGLLLRVRRPPWR